MIPIYPTTSLKITLVGDITIETRKNRFSIILSQFFLLVGSYIELSVNDLYKMVQPFNIINTINLSTHWTVSTSKLMNILCQQDQYSMSTRSIFYVYRINIIFVNKINIVCLQDQYSMSTRSIFYMSTISIFYMSTKPILHVYKINILCLQDQYSMSTKSILHVYNINIPCLQDKYSMSTGSIFFVYKINITCLQYQYSISTRSIFYVYMIYIFIITSLMLFSWIHSPAGPLTRSQSEVKKYLYNSMSHPNW